MKRPSFSVVVTTSDPGAAAVAIRSVIAQTDHDLEVVVVDCGANDEIAALIATFGDARIRHHRASGLDGLGAQRAGVAATCGEILVFVTDADELLPNALDQFRGGFDGSNRDAVVCGCIAVSGDRNEWSAQGPDVDAVFRSWPDVPAGTLALKRSLLSGDATSTSRAPGRDRITVIAEPLVVRYAAGASAARPGSLAPPTRGAIHGVLVTFGRPESLAAMIAELGHAGLGSLTIVDNAPTPESTRIALDAGAALNVEVVHVPMPENTGPAGGIATGMSRVLADAHDNDWIIVLDDDGLGGSSDTPARLREYGEWLLERGAPVGAVGLVGARFDRRSGRLVRPRDEELAGPVTLDYIAGGQMLMIRVAAAREVGVFDPDYFFAFDDLDYCLRLARNGYRVYADGPAWYEERRRLGRLGPTVGRAARRMSAWRRYYAVRNHIVIMRRYASLPSAIVVTFANLFGRPFSDLRKRQPGWGALTVSGTRACFDAWAGRLGRRVDPPPT